MNITITLGKTESSIELPVILSHGQLIKKLEAVNKDVNVVDKLYTQVQQQVILADDFVISNLGDLYPLLCSKIEEMLNNSEIKSMADVEDELSQFMESQEVKAVLDARVDASSKSKEYITASADVGSFIVAEFYSLKPQIMWFFNLKINGREPHDAILESFFSVSDIGTLTCSNTLKVANEKVVNPIAFSVPLPTRTLAALQTSRAFTQGTFNVMEDIETTEDSVEGIADSFSDAVDMLTKDIAENSPSPASSSCVERTAFKTLTLGEVARGKMSFNAKVEKFMRFSRTAPMRAVSLREDLNGSASFLIDYLCPSYIHPHVGQRRIEAFRKLLTDRSLLDGLVSRIVDKKILRGRTQYGHNVIALSEVITSINEVLSSVSATTRPLVAIPLLYITLAELQRTGLIRDDINIMFLTPELKPVNASFYHLQTSIMRGELRAHIQAFLKNLNGVEYKGTVLPDALRRRL